MAFISASFNVTRKHVYLNIHFEKDTSQRSINQKITVYKYRSSRLVYQFSTIKDLLVLR